MVDKDDKLIVINKFWNHDTEAWDELDSDKDYGHCTSVAVVDWENDGDLDLLLGDYRAGDIFLRINEGTATKPDFATENTKIMVGESSAVLKGGVGTPRIADWNGDGLFDIVCGGINGGVYLLQNTGSEKSPRFDEWKTLIEPFPGRGEPKVVKRVESTEDMQPVGPGSSFHIEVVDYDKDGDLDLLVGGRCKWKAGPGVEQTPEVVERLKEISKLSDEVANEMDDLRNGKTKQEINELRKSEEYRSLSNQQTSLRTERRKLMEDGSETGDFIWLFRRNSTNDLLSKQEQSVDQGAAIASLIAAYEKARDDYRTASAAAESAEEKQKLKRISVDDYSADMMAVIEHDVKSLEAFGGLLWLYDKTKRRDDDKGRQVTENYLALVMKHHYANKRIGRVADWLGHVDNSQRTEQHLLKILENNKHEVDLANTVLALIRHYQAIKEIQTDSVRRGYAEKSLGKEGMKYVDSRSREELNLLIDKYFEMGLQKYGEVQVWRGTFAETLAPYHFEHTRLQIGMQVPDIVGEDIDGVKFKLSDYKGQVVMLDFWGDW